MHNDITDLIGLLLGEDMKISVFPESSASLVDVDQWDLYRKTINLVKPKAYGCK